MVHVAVEQCRDGDIVVVAPTGATEHGYLGELIATAFQARGVRAFVADAGVRDVAELREMQFPAWSRYVSALGTVKETLGDVNVPIVCAGQRVEPGDVVLADDDGVVVVPRANAVTVLEASRGREEKEAVSRERYRAGELSLDVQNMRGDLERAGLRYE
jgi:4-hydroxy-4-methyl-2-oxoglutarate aldolase